MIKMAQDRVAKHREDFKQTAGLLSGYNHPDYANSLREFGNPVLLPRSQGRILERPIAKSDYTDASGCYPLFTCSDWQGLAEDIHTLRNKGLVSLSLVSDPFTMLSFDSLKKIFSDHCVPFKEHYLVDFSSEPQDIISSHHRYYARRSLRRYSVELLNDPTPHIETWQHLYQELVKRHQISGIQVFSDRAFEKQLILPGSMVFRAYDENGTAGMQIWYAMKNHVYHHLSAYSKSGYKNRVSYALTWEALHYFHKHDYLWLDLGAGAGLNNKKDGLTTFKEGWSNTTRPAFLCGKIFDRQVYRQLQQQTGCTTSRYFPAYRDPQDKNTIRNHATIGTDNNGARSPNFRRNTNLETLLSEINDLLAGAERQALQSYSKPQKPVVLIVGAPRSGTTLLLQWLAQSGYFAYPSNLISRFFRAPYIGARIQQMMFDPKYAFRNEMTPLAGITDSLFRSELGKTEGPLAPNEFWYFWRRFFQFNDRDYLTEKELQKIDMPTFLRELAAVEDVWQKPLAMKGMIINLHIPFIADHFGRVLFIHLRRHPFYNIQSLIQTRKKYFGDTNCWYSFKPPQFPDLKNKPAAHQVAGQIYYLNRLVEEGFSALDKKQVLQVDYESFCSKPEKWWRKIMKKMSALGEKSDSPYHGPQQFKVNNQARCSFREKQKWIDAWYTVSGKTIVP
jgi:hypothetical protein